MGLHSRCTTWTAASDGHSYTQLQGPMLRRPKCNLCHVHNRRRIRWTSLLGKVRLDSSPCKCFHGDQSTNAHWNVGRPMRLDAPSLTASGTGLRDKGKG